VRWDLAYAPASTAEAPPDAILFRMRGGSPYGESRLGGDYAAVRAAIAPGDLRQLRDMRRSGVMEAFAGGATRATWRRSSATRSTARASCSKPTNPVDLEKVRQTDDARLEGRRRRNKG
jgi:hypothetical protein